MPKGEKYSVMTESIDCQNEVILSCTVLESDPTANLIRILVTASKSAFRTGLVSVLKRLIFITISDYLPYVRLFYPLSILNTCAADSNAMFAKFVETLNYRSICSLLRILLTRHMSI